MTKIKTVIFDLGRVLVDFSFEPFSDFLKQHGAQFESLQDLVAKVRMKEYETGELSTTEFIENALSLLDAEASYEELVRSWIDIFTPVDEMLALATSLKKTHTVGILSNTSELHWEYLLKKYKLDSVADHLFASFELGVMKPDPSIYNFVMEATSSIPEESLFIDDIAENVEGARRCGWHGFVHSSHSNTLNELSKLGVVNK